MPQCKYFISTKAGRYALLIFSCALTGIIYYPALDSRFLLDDFYNLGGLGEVAAKGMAFYIFEGFAGPSGRPLALLSFAIQHTDWPDHPASFKSVNLIIHLLNGILIWFISRRLISSVENDKQYQFLFSFLVTSMWLLHPIHFTTVLYVVQRMTQLSVFFTLVGLLGYLYGRTQLLESRSRRPLILMSFSVVGGTVFSILSKEIGILLPLFILIVEATLLIQVERSMVWKKWAWTFLVLPLVVFLFYLIANFEGVASSYGIRSFTLEQRLLTEPGVLLTYLKHLVFPSYGAFTLYHDDYPISTGILQPWHTLPSLVGILALLLSALVVRKRMPVVSFAILWFFAGHLLESSYLNLELYFEHRNYLPGFGVFFGISWLLISLLKNFRLKMILVPGVIAYYTLIIGVSTIESNNWSRPVVQAMEWARKHPQSVRALDDLAYLHLLGGDIDSARRIYQRIDDIRPRNMYTAIQEIKIANCQQRASYSESKWQGILEKARVADATGFKMVSALDSLMSKIVNNECDSIDLDRVSELLSTLIHNQNFSRLRGFLFEFSATLKVYTGEYSDALDYIREAIRHTSKPSHYVYEIRLLKILKRTEEMNAKIGEFKQAMYKDPRRYLAYNKLLDSLEVY